MFRAILNANEHGEPVSVGFPIFKSVYADTITKLQKQSMGDVVNQDCRVEEIISSTFPVLRQVLHEKTKSQTSAAFAIWRGRATEWTRPAACGGARDMEFARTRM